MVAAARESDLVIVRKRPVIFREGDPPLIALHGMMRAVRSSGVVSRSNLDRTTADHSRTRGGKIHPEYSAVKLAIGFPP